MITLDVEEYCHSCLDFSPDVTKPERVLQDGELVMSDTIVRCKYRKRCSGMIRYLEQHTKGEK